MRWSDVGAGGTEARIARCRTVLEISGKTVTAGALAMLLLCAGCGPAGSEDLLAIKSARSIVAEWALINREAAAGRLSRLYADGMRREALAQLAAEARAANPNGPVAQAIGRVSRLPADASPELLDAAAQNLSAIEDQLEPA